MSSDVLQDFMELEPFSAAVRKHPRTVMRWCKTEGLPYTRNGRTILIHVPAYRDWLLGRMRNRNKPRSPAKEVADQQQVIRKLSAQRRKIRKHRPHAVP
jgi:hypothetical protein